MKILKKDNIDQFIQDLQAQYDLFAPAQDGSAVVWTNLESAKQLLWDFSNSDLSPKKFFFPQTECLMHFKNNPQLKDGLTMEPEPGLAKPRLLFNIRPCDAKAFTILDSVFARDEASTDVYWQDKRAKTVLIGLACKNPCPTCFCTSMDCGPHHTEGLDILLTDLGDELLVTPLSSKGEDLVKNLPEADSNAKEKAEAQKQAAEKSIKTHIAMDRIQSREVLEVYESPIWDKLHETCINCGTCTFFCPTCHCFDIQDETQDDFGRRVRNWDTCMSWLFTHHTSGHNPRGTKKDRFRQRFMHKFKYMPIKLAGAAGCVGCGRCTQKCPVNIDVREVVSAMNK